MAFLQQNFIQEKCGNFKSGFCWNRKILDRSSNIRFMINKWKSNQNGKIWVCEILVKFSSTINSIKMFPIFQLQSSSSNYHFFLSKNCVEKCHQLSRFRNILGVAWRLSHSAFLPGRSRIGAEGCLLTSIRPFWNPRILAQS